MYEHIVVSISRLVQSLNTAKYERSCCAANVEQLWTHRLAINSALGGKVFDTYRQLK